MPASAMRVSAAQVASIPADLGTVVPAQWPPGRYRRAHRGGGVARLGAALLADAWRCLDSQATDRASRARQAALQWFLDPPGAEAITLVFACALAGVEPEAVRRRVRARLRHEGRAVLG